MSISTTDNPAAPRDRHAFELAAETITLRIRWFGLVFGFVLVNVLRDDNRLLLNAILGVGLGYAILDTLWSLRGLVFLRRWPLVISLLEAVFVGLLCANDHGLQSPFLFYYLLSLLVCAIRYTPTITSFSFLLHVTSFGLLAFSLHAESRDDVTTMVLMVVLMGWVTWASTAFAELGKSVGSRLAQLNDKLQQKANEQRDPEKKLRLMVHHIVSFFSQNRFFFRLMSIEDGKSEGGKGENRKRWLEERRSQLEAIEGVLNDGVDEGVFAVGNARLEAAILRDMVRSAMIHSDGDISGDDR